MTLVKINLYYCILKPINENETDIFNIQKTDISKHSSGGRILYI